MRIEIISKEVFTSFASKHFLKSFFQTTTYGDFANKGKYSSMYIGAYKDGKLVAASLILSKEISFKVKYGYAPRGFLIDYFNTELLTEFTKAIKGFFFIRGYAFIKINPEITYATIDYKNKTKQINKESEELISTLKSLGYNKLKNNLYYSYILPKYTPIIYLNEYQKKSNNLNDISKNGLNIKVGDLKDIDKFYTYLNTSYDKHTKDYYNLLYSEFSKTNSVDLLLIELNYSLYIKYLQKIYAEKQEENDKINTFFKQNPNDDELYHKKLESDKELNDINNSIALSNKRLELTNMEVVGSALIIKQDERATLLSFGTKEIEKDIYVKTFIINSLLDKYKSENFMFLDLYEIIGSLNDENIYSKKPDFKLEYNPSVYEYIGEFDLSISKTLHRILLTTNKLQKEFSRKVEIMD